MAWTRSGWHPSWVYLAVSLGAVTEHSLANPIWCTVYDNTRTPDDRVTQGNGYGRGCWNGGELTSPPGWPANGVQVPGGITAAVAGTQVRLDGADVRSGSPVNFTPFGSMLYDRITALTYPFLSVMFHYFGGAVPARNGTFEIHWADTGLAVMGVPVTPVPVP